MDGKEWPGDFCHCYTKPMPATLLPCNCNCILQYKIIVITVFSSVLCSVVVNVLCFCFLNFYINFCHCNEQPVSASGMRWPCIQHVLSLWTVWCSPLLCQWCHLSPACRATEMIGDTWMDITMDTIALLW